jgi:predicted ATP-binding protein involved in virulence
MKKLLIIAITFISQPAQAESHAWLQYQDQQAFERQKYENQRKFETQQKQAIDRQIESQKWIDKIKRDNKKHSYINSLK